MRRTAILTFVAFAAACSKPAPPPPAPVAVATPVPTPPPAAMGEVTLGSELAADKTVAMGKEMFGVKDKVYASVATSGVGHIKLRAVWSFVKGDKTTQVNETTMELDSTGPAVNEFHIENTKAWPKGDYKVEIFFNDAEAPAVTKTFKVQ
ncbi:MAG: hypothetical protein ABI672_03390 [Vicinamibacteria bacterium]